MRLVNSKTYHMLSLFSLLMMGTQGPCYAGKTPEENDNKIKSISVKKQQEESNSSATPSSLKKEVDFNNMSQEELIKQIMKLQLENKALKEKDAELKEIMDAMSSAEKEGYKLLARELPKSVKIFIVALEAKREGKPISEKEAKVKVEKKLCPQTFNAVLNDKGISGDTARKVFRGLITAIDENTVLNLKKYPFSSIEGLDKRVKTCVTAHLAQSNLLNIMYSVDSVTNFLIEQFTSKKGGSFIQKNHSGTLSAMF